jgi:hypothetical protein
MKPEIMLEQVPGRIFWLTWKDTERSRYICSILIVVQMVKGQQAEVLLRIQQMNTVVKHRRQGYASKLIDEMKTMFGGHVRYIISMWDQSTEAGRLCLIKNGFKRISNTLIWENENGKQQQEKAVGSNVEVPSGDNAGERPQVDDKP